VTALSEEELSRALEALPGWQHEGDGIVKEFKFHDFTEAIAFINRLAERAEAADHHPNLENHYNRVKVSLFTWSEKAITDKDIALARQIESVAERPG
jgi:4a-hydroxytetrahydrobiopterin dehydratase